MNKSTWQSFAAGIIFATAILAGIYYYEYKLKVEEPITQAEAKKFLEDQGFNVTKKTSTQTTTIESKEVAKETPESPPPSSQTKQEEVISYTLHVTYKMTVEDVANILEQKKIIDNATNFKDYMQAKKLTRKVQVNEYNVTSEMSYTELSELLTK